MQRLRNEIKLNGYRRPAARPPTALIVVLALLIALGLHHWWLPITLLAVGLGSGLAIGLLEDRRSQDRTPQA